MAVTPFPGHRRASGLDRGADRRLDLVERLVRGVRYPPGPLFDRTRGGLPGRPELLGGLACVTIHDPSLSPHAGCGQWPPFPRRFLGSPGALIGLVGGTLVWAVQEEFRAE